MSKARNFRLFKKFTFYFLGDPCKTEVNTILDFLRQKFTTNKKDSTFSHFTMDMVAFLSGQIVCCVKEAM